ncbi:MAG: DUF4296 domain-containing protein [Polaribacter sp.]|uniref:DUF4296 domain-containing protein n=1 Tax=Polaribacter sp. TaxID=1920175 RepID=UPI0026085D9E|nr:DUF4296 domain-containing protein [uncultured Polaribacter sp.]
MKNISHIILLLLLFSCTSNTIFKKPKDLIPKDTMSLLIQDMMVASSAKFIKNKHLQKNINYMAFIYDRYLIDSLRFQTSNLYYTSKIDEYEEIINDVNVQLEKKKAYYKGVKAERDSLKRDSIKNTRLEIIDTTKIKKRALDLIKKED